MHIFVIGDKLIPLKLKPLIVTHVHTESELSYIATAGLSYLPSWPGHLRCSFGIYTKNLHVDELRSPKRRFKRVRSRAADLADGSNLVLFVALEEHGCIRCTRLR